MRREEWRDDDTIVAVATPPGEGAIGVVRLSGPAAFALAGRVFRPARGEADVWHGYRARYGFLHDPATGERIDEAVALAMAAPRSYTCEDIVEFSCHGGPAVLLRVVEALVASGARLAEPGEFTRRAFLNGRIDLAQAEAVIDLIRARSDGARRAALEQLGGGLSRRVAGLRERIVRCLAHVEASLDFPEDEVEGMSGAELAAAVADVGRELGDLLEGYRSGRIVREGARVVIAGRPNVGKSSLLNALLGLERALVTEVPGTTRDLLEECIVAAGVPLVLVDTAGVRETSDSVERLGVERSRQALREADVVLFVCDDAEGWTEEDEAVAVLAGRERVVVALNKVDQGRRRVPRTVLERVFPGRPVLEVSAREGLGLGALREALARAVWAGGSPREAVLVTRARHAEALARCRAAVGRAGEALEGGLPLEVVALELREAGRALGEVTGETVDEEVLDTVFREFCIGK